MNSIVLLLRQAFFPLPLHEQRNSLGGRLRADADLDAPNDDVPSPTADLLARIAGLVTSLVGLLTIVLQIIEAVGPLL